MYVSCKPLIDAGWDVELKKRKKTLSCTVFNTKIPIANILGS